MTISMKDDGANPFRRASKVVLVGGVVLYFIFILVFMIAQMTTPRADPNTWMLRLIKDHYAALIQVPAVAVMSFVCVFLFEVVSGQRIEFEALGFKFRGAAGPIVLWIFVFLAMIFATKLLWSAPGLH
jgi:hypothetical protein